MRNNTFFDAESLTKEEYLGLFQRELEEAIAPHNWTVERIDRFFKIRTPSWVYSIALKRFEIPTIEPENDTKSWKVLVRIVNEIMTKKR
jgi:hypothetical protein